MKLKFLFPVFLVFAFLMCPQLAAPSDISVTAANVVWVSGKIVRDNNAGTTITAGQVVYLTAANKWALAQCDGTAIEAGTDTTVGIALHAALSGQPLAVQTEGVVTIGGTVTVGQVYCISATAGGVAPYADLVSTNKLYVLGVGITSANIRLGATGAIGVSIP